jgi:hypothetical protein
VEGGEGGRKGGRERERGGEGKEVEGIYYTREQIIIKKIITILYIKINNNAVSFHIVRYCKCGNRKY